MPDDAPPPLEKEATISRLPPAGKKFPCPSCGARLDFDPNARGLVCPYCNYTSEIETDLARKVEERDYFSYVKKLQEASQVQGIVGHTNETRCGGCGANVILDDKVAADKCPFCHTFLEGTPKPVEGLIEPESMLPFALDLRAARDSYSKWISGLWFAPSELTKIANLGQLAGVYVPYWTYDSMTSSPYRGERGDNYTDYETRTVTGPDGQQRTERVAVTRIAWTNVGGNVRHFFDDVLVCGSKSLPPELITGLEPWDIDKLEPFQTSYISGFQAEHYAIGLQDGMKDAKRQMDFIIQQLIRRDIGGDHQRIRDYQTKYDAVTFKHTLLPVWLAVYRYRDDVYQILVNGRTGKVTGRRPWSAWKIARLVILIGLVLATFAYLFFKYDNQNQGAPRKQPTQQFRRETGRNVNPMRKHRTLRPSRRSHVQCLRTGLTRCASTG